jgi:hypothetical protein
MNTSTHIHQNPEEVGAEALEVSGAGLRVVEVALVGLGGFLVSPPLAILAVVVAVPIIAMLAVAGAVFAVVAVPIALVRRVRAHHIAHRSTLFLHRLSW